MGENRFQPQALSPGGGRQGPGHTVQGLFVPNAVAEHTPGGLRVGRRQECKTHSVCEDFPEHPCPPPLKVIIRKGGFSDTFNVHLHYGLPRISILFFLRSRILFIWSILRGKLKGRWNQ